MALVIALLGIACSDLPNVGANPATPGSGATEVAFGGADAPTATAVPATPTVAPTATPSPTPTPEPPKSAIEGKTWLTLYGRGWGIAPILGRLGMYENPDDMVREITPWIEEIKLHNNGKEVVPVIHLIYAMAIPCEPDNHCLLYLDTAGEDIVEDYIKPAAERGWQVILDSQIGSSNPVEQVQRMIDRGYLAYPNVHVALDPEFHVYPGEDLPGIPIGQLDAADLNEAQRILNDYVAEQGLPVKKVMMVHQFGDPMVDDGVPYMITNKKTLETYENVDLVLDADGFGAPAAKTRKYNLMLDDEEYPFIKYRAIKLFFFNPYEERHHGDFPEMTWPQVLGVEEINPELKIRWQPDIIVVA